MPTEETPKAGETTEAKTLGTEAGATAPPAGNASGTDDGTSSPKGVDPKEHDKIVMERNLLRRKVEEAEKTSEEARKKDLESKEEFKKLYEEAQEKLREFETRQETAERERKEKELRDSVLQEYPEEVRKLADELGLNWDDSSDEETQREQLKAKLEKLSPAASGNTEGGEVKVGANNPGPQSPPSRQDLIREATETGDWSKVLHDIPSVEARVKEFET